MRRAFPNWTDCNWAFLGPAQYANFKSTVTTIHHMGTLIPIPLDFRRKIAAVAAARVTNDQQVSKSMSPERRRQRVFTEVQQQPQETGPIANIEGMPQHCKVVCILFAAISKCAYKNSQTGSHNQTRPLRHARALITVNFRTYQKKSLPEQYIQVLRPSWRFHRFVFLSGQEADMPSRELQDHT